MKYDKIISIAYLLCFFYAVFFIVFYDNQADGINPQAISKQIYVFKPQISKAES